MPESGPTVRLPSPRQRHRLRQQRQSGSPQHPPAGARCPALLELPRCRWTVSLRSGGHPGAGRRGVRSHERLFKAMMADPRAGAGQAHRRTPGTSAFGYRLGRFPSQWLRSMIVTAIQCAPSGAGMRQDEFCPRLVGSDLFPKTGAPPTPASTSLLSEATLEDLVSYNQRHNQANGEDNQTATATTSPATTGWRGRP